MNFRRRTVPVLVPLILCGLLAAGCAGRRDRPGLVPDGSPQAGLYQGRYITPEKTTRFRAFIWAAQPDRLHLELFGPMGGTRLAVDGGSGLLAVSLVQDKIAYAGPAASLDLAPVFGLSLTLQETVAALTGGEPPEGLAVWRRDADPRGGPVLRLQVGTGEAVLELTRLETRTVRNPEGLGTGEVRPGLKLLPLSRLLQGDNRGLLQ